MDFFRRQTPGRGEDFRQALLGQRTLRPYLADRVREAVTRAGSGGLCGWADDDLALVRPWGFDLGRITVPVSVWLGGRDARAPRAHADWLLARVPAAQGREHPGGHEPGDAGFGRILAWIAVPAA